MSLSEKEQQEYAVSQSAIMATTNFLANFQKVRQNGTVGLVDAYDSCHDNAVKSNQLDSNIPQALVDIFDSVGPEGRPYILAAIEKGISMYQGAHGGDMPRSDMVASALVEGLRVCKSEYDSASGTNLNSAGMESLSVVPSQTVVAIATRIANALPLIAYLPNPSGSNEVPVVYGRNKATHTYGEMKADEYLDGPKASRQYFDPQFEFVATKDGADAKKYTLAAHVAYADIDLRTPDVNAKSLPFMGGRVRVLVNGVEVANDANKSHARFKGTSSLVPIQDLNFVVDGVEVKVASGLANLNNNTVEVNFLNALPADAKVTIKLIADYERKDTEGKPVLAVPSVDIDLIASAIFAYPMRAIYRATNDAVNQMQRELGVDMRGAMTAVIASKFQLEQNIRLLKDLKRRTEGLGRILTADLLRGSTDTPAFNNTSEQARELLVTISMAKVMINKLLDVVPSGHDIYVTDKMSVLFDNLSDDTHYKKIMSAVGSPNQIVRIGTIDGNINVYHVPHDSGLLTEESKAAEIMIIGRSGEAVRNPFVGFITNPMMVKESNTVDFESGVTIQATGGSELNPIGRFSDQCVIVNVTNLPVSIVGA